jgi:hypothetical protein
MIQIGRRAVSSPVIDKSNPNARKQDGAHSNKAKVSEYRPIRSSTLLQFEKVAREED